MATHRIAGWILALCLIAGGLSPASADLIVPPPDAPKFRISSAKLETGKFGKEVLVIKYKRTRKGNGWDSVVLAGKSNGEPLRFVGMQPKPKKASGELRISSSGFNFSGKSPSYEVYFAYKPRWDRYIYGPCLVSNIMRVGNPGAASSAREWNAKEKAAYQKHKLSKTPPGKPPKGYVKYSKSITLAVGMPVKVGSYGKWVDAEIVENLNNRAVKVWIESEQRLILKMLDKWVAFDANVAKQSPSSFKPTVQFLPGSSLALPKEATALPSGTKLPRGVPLLLENGSWQDCFVISATSSEIKVRLAGRSAIFDRAYPRAKFAIHRNTLADLRLPDAEEKYAKNIKEPVSPSTPSTPGAASGIASGIADVTPGAAAGPPKRLKSYPVSIDVAEGAGYVPPDLRLQPGTKLAACWNSKWRPVTVLYENADGTVSVHWDGYNDAWDCSMKREELIIAEQTVKMLKGMQGPSLDDLKKTLRTWTDATGKHKVEARFVSRTNTHVMLKTDAGREISLPLEKLSQADRDLLEHVKPEE